MSKRQPPTDVSVLHKKPRTLTITKLGFLFLRSLHTPFISSTTGSPFRLSCLRSDRLYTIGRHRSSRRRCNLAFHDPRVNKRHCQIFFDGDTNKVFLLDGFVLLHPHSRRWCNLGEIKAGRVRPSLNGVFVNDVRVGKGKLVQLSVGDEVRFVCADDESGIKIGFVVEKIVLTEEDVQHLKQKIMEKSNLYCLARSHSPMTPLP